MFESLSKKLLKTFDAIRGKDKLSEGDVKDALREIKVALLEADVSLSVVKDLLKRIEEKAVGQKIIEDVSPANQVVKIVNDELVSMLGEKNDGFVFDKKPYVILMAGLNGSGKTTTTAKLGKFIAEKYGKKVLMLSTDVYRPQAREQLSIWGERIGVDTLPIIQNETPFDIIKRAKKVFDDYDVVLVDTAGRVSIDDEMMDEISKIKKEILPSEILLCVDALVGQDGINIARAFNDVLSLTGIVMTRVDGDARGGSALSMKASIGVPVKFLGSGEKIDDLELFFPDRIASRILGMGDIVSLVEKAQEKIDEAEASRLAERMMAGQFTFEDMLAQFKQVKKMGSIAGIMKFLPGIGGLAEKLQSMGMNDGMMKRQEAIILSMTSKERRNPDIILMGRKKRIAKGAGVSVSDVEKLIRQYQKTKSMMDQMNSMGGIKGLMAMAKQMQDSGEFANMPDLSQFKL
ncbi:MAG: signal recognition particle protein [Alphaproteobacteria bacterium]|nr:signal recognition particle protein [Alphaproteobacteria bacterium]